jgi:hypothetical protein
VRFSKILIPIDFSERCLGAARFAIPWRSALTPRLRFCTLSLRRNTIWKRLLSARRALRNNFVTFFPRRSRTLMSSGYF